jgi:Na+-driven multidrug efflux pump
MYSTLAQYWAVRLPVALGGVFVLDAGIAAVFWAVTFSNVVAAVWLAALFAYSSGEGMLDRAAGETTGATG